MEDRKLILDYKITHIQHPHYVKDRGCVYDHVKWTVWIGNGDLLDDISEAFNYSINLKEHTDVSEEMALAIWHYVQERKDLIGMFGCDYDTNILDIYKNKTEIYHL